MVFSSTMMVVNGGLVLIISWPGSGDAVSFSNWIGRTVSTTASVAWVGMGLDRICTCADAFGGGERSRPTKALDTGAIVAIISDPGKTEGNISGVLMESIGAIKAVCGWFRCVCTGVGLRTNHKQIITVKASKVPTTVKFRCLEFCLATRIWDSRFPAAFRSAKISACEKSFSA